MYIGYAQVHRRVRRRVDKRALKCFFTVFVAVCLLYCIAQAAAYQWMNGYRQKETVEEVAFNPPLHALDIRDVVTLSLIHI